MLGGKLAIGMRCLVDGALGLCSEANYVAEAMAASGLLGSMDLVEVQYSLFLVLVVVCTIPTAVYPVCMSLLW